jgi:hypothetical protein
MPRARCSTSPSRPVPSWRSSSSTGRRSATPSSRLPHAASRRKRFAAQCAGGLFPCRRAGPAVRQGHQGPPVHAGGGGQRVHRGWFHHPVGRETAMRRQPRHRASVSVDDMSGLDDALKVGAGAVPGHDPRHQPQRRHHHRRHVARPVTQGCDRLFVLPGHPDSDRRRRLQPVQGACAADNGGSADVRRWACCSPSSVPGCASAGCCATSPRTPSSVSPGTGLRSASSCWPRPGAVPSPGHLEAGCACGAHGRAPLGA